MYDNSNAFVVILSVNFHDICQLYVLLLSRKMLQRWVELTLGRSGSMASTTCVVGLQQ